VIELDRVAARRRPLALASVSLRWGAGVHAVLGRREDGGALLLALIAGAARPRSGRVTVLGGAPEDASVRTRVAVVPLDPTLPDALRVGEALVLATRAGLDPEVVFNAIKGGLAGSTVLNAKAPMVIGRNFKPGFRIRLHQKDLRNALLAAESMKVPLPLTSEVQQMIMALMNQGSGDLDHSAIVNYVEKMAQIEIKRPVTASA